MSVKIGVIVGSTRPTRVGRKVADWFMDQVKNTPGVEFELLDLAEINLPFLAEPKLPSQGDYQMESTKSWSAMIDRQDGFIWVTPEYNHGYSPALKNAIDTLYAEWSKKPVGFVGYGTLGAPAAIEQLVNVAAQMYMVPQPAKATKVVETWAAFDEQGNVKEDHRKGAPPEVLVENLVWWAEALKAARQKAE